MGETFLVAVVLSGPCATCVPCLYRTTSPRNVPDACLLSGAAGTGIGTRRCRSRASPKGCQPPPGVGGDCLVSPDTLRRAYVITAATPPAVAVRIGVVSRILVGSASGVFAAKIIPKAHLKSAGESFIKATMLERNILGEFDHPFLLKLYHSFREAHLA